MSHQFGHLFLFYEYDSENDLKTFYRLPGPITTERMPGMRERWMDVWTRNIIRMLAFDSTPASMEWTTSIRPECVRRRLDDDAGQTSLAAFQRPSLS